VGWAADEVVDTQGGRGYEVAAGRGGRPDVQALAALKFMLLCALLIQGHDSRAREVCFNEH